MEEVGLKVGRLHYYKSQPWSFTDTLLMGFFAELEGGEDIVLDQTELAMAEWFEKMCIRDRIWMPLDECRRRVRDNSMPHCILPEELDMLPF